jgi:hypothetical protein
MNTYEPAIDLLLKTKHWFGPTIHLCSSQCSGNCIGYFCLIANAGPFLIKNIKITPVIELYGAENFGTGTEIIKIDELYSKQVIEYGISNNATTQFFIQLGTSYGGRLPELRLSIEYDLFSQVDLRLFKLDIGKLLAFFPIWRVKKICKFSLAQAQRPLTP